jgi:hypothetical protein
MSVMVRSPSVHLARLLDRAADFRSAELTAEAQSAAYAGERDFARAM